MLRGSPAKSDRVAGSRRRSILDLRVYIRGAMRIAVAAGVLVCFGWQGLWAQASPQKLIVHRSTRAIPHKFVVHPNEAIVAVNQTQRFEVTDAQGRPVAVHWNVSGIGCSGMDCGTIDDEGVYRTPSSLPQPRVVTVEAVLASDPNYSVLTQVWLEDSVAAAVSATPGQVATGETQPLTAPEVGIPSLAKNAGLPLPNAIAAAPVLDRQNLASSAGSPPLPNVVAPAPAVGRRNLATGAELPPLPDVVAAAPTAVGRQLARSAGSPPLPTVIAAAPAVGRQTLAVSIGSPLLPNVVAPAPAIGRQNLASSAGLPSLPNVIAAAPSVGRQSLATSTKLPLPTVIAAAPSVGRQSFTTSAGSPPLPNVVAPAPAIGGQTLAVSVGAPPLPTVAALVSPTPYQVPAGKTQPLTATAVGKQNAAVNGVLTPMPDVVPTVPSGTVVSAQHGPVVTYRDGQLTIDAENLTLAAVLALVAEKTGAVIDVPPGSGLERIFEHTGPGPANDVLESLLNGSPFNFIIVSSPLHPNQPAQVLLSLHRPDTDIPAVASVEPKVSPPLWTPPAPSTAPLPQIDRALLQPPTEPLSPQALGELMKDKAKQLREQLQKQQ